LNASATRRQGQSCADRRATRSPSQCLRRTSASLFRAVAMIENTLAAAGVGLTELVV
jgi:hypothetical protein